MRASVRSTEARVRFGGTHTTPMLARKRARLLRRRSAGQPPDSDPGRPARMDQIPSLSGRMDREVLRALLAEWKRENDPEEDAAVLKALQEEFAEARRPS